MSWSVFISVSSVQVYSFYLFIFIYCGLVLNHSENHGCETLLRFWVWMLSPCTRGFPFLPSFSGVCIKGVDWWGPMNVNTDEIRNCEPEANFMDVLSRENTSRSPQWQLYWNFLSPVTIHWQRSTAQLNSKNSWAKPTSWMKSNISFWNY